MKHPRNNAFSRLLLLPIKKSKQLVSTLSGSGHGDLAKQPASNYPPSTAAQSNPNYVYARQNAIRSSRALEYIDNLEFAAQELPQILDSSNFHGEVKRTQEAAPNTKSEKETVNCLHVNSDDGDGDGQDESGDDTFEATFRSFSSLEVSSNSEDDSSHSISNANGFKISKISENSAGFDFRSAFPATKGRASNFSEITPDKSFFARMNVMQDRVSEISRCEQQSSPCTPKYRYARDSASRTPTNSAYKPKNAGNLAAKLVASNISYIHGIYSDNNKSRSASKVSNTKNVNMQPKHARSFSQIPLQNISNGRGVFGTATSTPPRLFREINSNIIPSTNDHSNAQPCKTASGKNQNKQVVWREGLLQRLGKLHDSGKCRMSLEELIDLDDNKQILGDLDFTQAFLSTQQVSSPRWRWRSSDKSETPLPSPLQCTSHTNSLFEKQCESFNSTECR